MSTKRVLSLVLVCFMILSLGTYAASYSDVPTTHERFEAIDSLSSSDIITGFPDGTFKPDDSVTRAQMAALITRMFKLSSGTVDEMPFSDVAKDHWASSNIVAAKKMGVINGFPDGTFKPDDKVTYEQAVKMIVSSLNYGSAAEAKGGWPNGYIQQAASLGITKKAIMAQAEPSPRGMIAQLLFNSTTVDMLVPVIKPDGTVEYQKPSLPNTVKDQFLNTKTIKNALVVAIPNVTLGAAELFCQSDEIWVQQGTNDAVKLKVGAKTTAKDFIGQAVDIDYTEDSVTKDLVISRITSLTSNKSYTIDVTNIEKIADDNSYIEYYEKKGDENTKKLSFSSTVNTIYNERYATDGLDLLKADLVSSGALNVNGTLTIVVGSTYTVAKIKSYKTFFVSTAPDTTKNEIIVDLPAGSTESSIYAIPVNDTYTNQIVIKKKNGETYTDQPSSTLYSISRNSLISIAQSKNKKYHEILIAPSAITGTITESSTGDNNEKVVTISSKTYSVAKGFEKLYPTQFDSVQYDANATFYVDCFGYISWVDKVSNGNVKNGLLVNATVTGASSIDKVATAKFFDLKTKTEFTVTLDSNNVADPNSDINKLKDKNNKLFNMDISSGNKVKAGKINQVTTSEIKKDTTIVAYNDHSASTSVTYTSSKYKFDKAATGESLTDVNVIFNPLSTTANADRKFVVGSLISEIAYEGACHYTINENGRVYNYIVVDTLQKVLESSGVYVVKEKGSVRSVNGGEDQVVEFKLLDFKTGAEKTINILESVSNSLGLVKGDVFTYYKTSTKTDVEIDNIANVTITLKIDKALATNKTTGYAGVAPTTKDGKDTMELAGKKDGYSIFTIYKDKYYDANYIYSLTYSLQLPLVYANDNAENELYLAMRRSTAQTVPTEVYLPNSSLTLTDDDFLSNQALTAKVENIMVKPLVETNKFFVYNASETDDTKKLITATTKDEINSLLDNLKTVKDVKADVQNADLVYTLIQNNYDNAISLKTVYIIKR